MRKIVWLLAGTLFPVAAIAADAPGPSWAFLTPDPNAPGAPAAEEAAPKAQPVLQPGALKIVLAGKGDAVRPCSTCHTPSGMGQPQSANIRGLNATYFARQMQDFRSGARSGPRSRDMARFAKGLSDDEIKEVAAYYAELKPSPWTKVTEATTAPKTIVGRNNRRVKLPGTDTEQVGNRIVEVGTRQSARAQMSEPAFVAYVPPGSLASGKTLVTGGGGKTQACSACHGAKLQGKDDVPGIAGRSPIYIARQIYSFKSDLRKGPMAETMKGVVANLSEDDVIKISSYIASLNPA